MGLDSVELIMTFEEYFEINIPDSKAEYMITIENVCDYFCEKLDIKSNAVIDYTIFKTSDLLEILSLENEEKVFVKFPIEDEMFWKELKTKTNLEIPKPRIKREKKFENLSIIKQMFYSNPDYKYLDITLSRFLEVVAFTNYQKLVDKPKISTAFEIFAVVAGITLDKNGLDPYEIYRKSKFVDDLGIN